METAAAGLPGNWHADADFTELLDDLHAQGVTEKHRARCIRIVEHRAQVVGEVGDAEPLRVSGRWRSPVPRVVPVGDGQPGQGGA